MDRRRSLGFGIAAIALAAAAPGSAPAQVAPVAAAGAAQTIDPVAIQALRNMGVYLKTLQSFEIRSKATIETNVEDSDIKITVGLENVYRVQRPNRFQITMTSDRLAREFYYDGKNFTVHVPRQQFYSTVAAPATISQVVEDIYDQFGITMPLSDLFFWADDGAPTDGIQSAMRVGFAKIGGVDTDQFVFRGELLDFQVWISRGPRPLPMKIVITTRTDPTRPSYSAELSWNTTAKFTPATFAFKPDAKTSAIPMARLPAPGE